MSLIDPTDRQDQVRIALALEAEKLAKTISFVDPDSRIGPEQGVFLAGHMIAGGLAGNRLQLIPMDDHVIVRWEVD